MINYMITAKHYGGSMKKYILKQQADIKRRRGILIPVFDLNNPPVGRPVLARIWQGQWIADCDECNNAMFVDPDEPIFYCVGCTNRRNSHKPRPVTFPEQREEIERLILARPVDDVAGLTDLERAGLAKATIFIEVDGQQKPLVRSWMPGETVQDLKKQNKAGGV